MAETPRGRTVGARVASLMGVTAIVIVAFALPTTTSAAEVSASPSLAPTAEAVHTGTPVDGDTLAPSRGCRVDADPLTTEARRQRTPQPSDVALAALQARYVPRPR